MTDTQMAVAALVVSVVALGVSGVSALYTRRQADEGRRLRQLEDGRRREELAARVGVELEAVSGMAWRRLVVDNGSDRTVTSIEVSILDGPGCWFTTGTNGVEPGVARPQRAVLHDRLGSGCQYRWQMEFDEKETTGVLRLSVKLLASDDAGQPARWSKVVDLQPPTAPSAIY